MVKYGSYQPSSVGHVALFGALIWFNFVFLEFLIIKPKNKKDVTLMIIVCFFLYQIETSGLFLWWAICKYDTFVSQKIFFYFVGGTILLFNILFYRNRKGFPYWVDDDKAEEIEEPSKSSFQKNIEDLDAVVKPAVDKEIANIHQDQAAEAMAQQSSKNTGGKNTEITVNVANGLDLNNKTIVLPQKPKQSSKDNEQ